MYIDLMKTLTQIEKKLDTAESLTVNDLHKAYILTMRMRSQLLGAIHELETFGEKSGVTRLAEQLSCGYADDGIVILTINEPLPPTKELTSAVEDHWLELIHNAIDKAAQENPLSYFSKAFVWIEIITPKYSYNAKLWDTSNRAVNLIINNLKGVFFADDDHEHMAFGVAGRWGGEGATIVRVMSNDRLEQVLTPIFRFSL